MEGRKPFFKKVPLLHKGNALFQKMFPLQGKVFGREGVRGRESRVEKRFPPAKLNIILTFFSWAYIITVLPKTAGAICLIPCRGES